MKKYKKIFFISLASLLGFIFISISVVIWFVFTPERITPIIRSQAEKFITCQSQIGKVELTFFSTFPRFGLKIDRFALINPYKDAPSDTLVRVDELIGTIDAAAWWKNKELIITGFTLNKGAIHAFADSAGNTNFNIFATDTAVVADEEPGTVFAAIDISNVEMNHVDLHYIDLSAKLKAVITDLTAKMDGTMKQDSISSRIRIENSIISLESGGVKYLQEARVQCNFPVDVIPSRQFIKINKASASVNELEIILNGTIENDTVNQRINTNLDYRFKSWPVREMVALVPPTYSSYFKDMEVDGLLTSDGSIKGVYSESTMPLLNIHLLMKNCALKYPGFPLPVHDIDGDITFYSDLKTDSLSFIRINRFSAKTPESVIKTSGSVDHLLTDIHCDLTTDAGLVLDEFKPLIPAGMKISLKGKATGKVRSAFSLNQLEKMQLERMKFSGSLTLVDFDLVYDSLSLKTGKSKIDFSLPNASPSAKNAGFINAAITSDYLRAEKLESFLAFLQHADIKIETSDVRDTTRIPDLMCTFSMDSLSGSMDTLSIAIANPMGKVFVSPVKGRPTEPKISLSYKSDGLTTKIGQNSAVIKKINIETDIINDKAQKDIFLQWLVKGFINMDQGVITMSSFSHPVEIPAIQMNFEPETFNIKESRIIIDKSDFQLSGILNNVLSYFRGDSILRGNFSFVSANTDVTQLMALTSGIGSEEENATEEVSDRDSDSTYAGPYMVPKGIDVILNTNIRKASWGIDTATGINGNVRVSDGILLLDGLVFTTPAARMQLTAMYRTPRKNHIFMGMDYHMLDIEIEELLTMIPDIDSLMPMLRSFRGKGEFHITIETYLDSLYNIKKSTLRGASSIKGNDLVLLDGQTFSEIAKKLQFNRKTENRVDSLSAEFTIFRNEVDVYPFLIVMDKYKAVIAGRHNFDLSFNYHVSVVDCPLPIKLGIDIIGKADAMNYNLAKCRYAEFYRPASRHAVENKQLELRQMIREALTQKVRTE